MERKKADNFPPGTVLVQPSSGLEPTAADVAAARAELAQRGDRSRQVWYVLGCLEAALDIVTDPRYGADTGAIACRQAQAFLWALDARPSAPTDAAPADLGTASAGHGRVVA